MNSKSGGGANNEAAFVVRPTLRVQSNAKIHARAWAENYVWPIAIAYSRISVFVAKKHSRSILRKILLECFFATKTLMRE